MSLLQWCFLSSMAQLQQEDLSLGWRHGSLSSGAHEAWPSVGRGRLWGVAVCGAWPSVGDLFSHQAFLTAKNLMDRVSNTYEAEYRLTISIYSMEFELCIYLYRC